MALPVALRGEADDAQFVFKFAVVVGAVHHPRPGFDADEGGFFVRRGPDTEVGQVGIADVEGGCGTRAVQADGGRCRGVVDEGVIGKSGVVKREVAFAGMRGGVEQAVAPAETGEIGAFYLDVVVGKGFAVGQRQGKGGVAADGEEQVFLFGRVVHLPADAQGIAQQGIAEVEGEGEGVVFGAFAVVFEAEADVVFVVVKQAEVTVACEAVLRQGVAVAAIAVFAVFQFADDGKEDGRAAFPVARIALPEVFAPAADEGLQLGAVV